MSKLRSSKSKSNKRKASVLEIIGGIIILGVLFLMQEEPYGARRLSRWEILLIDPGDVFATLLAVIFIVICIMVIRNIKIL